MFFFSTFPLPLKLDHFKSQVDKRPLGGWQRLYLNGLPLDPSAAVKQLTAELSHLEAERDAACDELLKDYREVRTLSLPRVDDVAAAGHDQAYLNSGKCL